MKLVILALLTLTTTAHAEGIQKFKGEVLSHWLNGPGDFGNPWMHSRCNEAEQAYARKGAEDNAKQKCEMAPGVKECLVKSSLITVNGRLDAATLAKYGLQERGDAYGYWGCEATAIVYGLE